MNLSRLIWISLSCDILMAQHQHPSSSARRETVVIDGANHPDLISDAIAHELILKAWSEPSLRSPEAAARQKAKLAPLNLSPSEGLMLTQVLSTFHDNIANLEGRFRASSGTSSDAASLEALKSQIIASSVGDIRTKLPEVAYSRFIQHVQREKLKMRIIPFPKMTK